MDSADLTVRRRVARILGHVAGSSPSDEAFPPSSLLPLNCSTTLNATLIQRRDSRVMFARQGSSSRGRFMHQVSSNLLRETAPDNCKHNGSCRQKLPSNDSLGQCREPPLFSRKATGSRSRSENTAAAANSPPPPPVPSSRSTDDNAATDAAPLFARKSCCSVLSSCSRSWAPQQQQQRRPSNVTGGGVEWCPRMDVAESRARFVVTVELPGVQAADIHLEVDNEKYSLTIMGKRWVMGEWRRAKGGGGGGCERLKDQNYHKREISEGPYRIVWPLPRDVDKDAVSAELLDGFLRITLLKL